MDGDWQRLADFIRAEIEARGWRQSDLAVKADVSTLTINNLVSGRAPRRWPKSIPAVERSLGWEPGSARSILEGGRPTVVTVPSEFADDPTYGPFWDKLTRQGGLSPEDARFVMDAIREDLDTSPGEGGEVGERRRRAPG